MAAARSELPPQYSNTSEDNGDDGVALWIVYSSAAAVGVAVAAFIVGFFLVKNVLRNKRRNSGGSNDDGGSQNKRARKDRSNSHDSHRSRSLKSIKDSPSAKVPVNENNEDIEDLEANIKPDKSSGSRGSKKSKADVPSVSGPYGDDDNVEVVNWNSGEEFEVALSPSNQTTKEDTKDEGAASKFFTSVASVIFPSATNDYFEKEEKDSLPSKEDIEMNKSVYTVKSTSNNTFNTFFRNLDVQVNEGAGGSACKPEAEMETPSVQVRTNLATTPKQVSDITMSMHPTKLGGDEETVSEPTQLPMLGLNESQASRSSSRSRSRSRSSRSTTSSHNETVGTREEADEATAEETTRSSRSTTSSYNETLDTRDKTIAEASTNDTDTDIETQTKTEPKKKSGIFKLFHKKGGKNKAKSEESDLHEVSPQGRASFLDDLAASEEGSTIRTEQDTIIRRTTSRKQSFLDNVMDEEGTFSMVSEVDDRTKQSTFQSKASTKGHSTKPSHDTRGTRHSAGASKISTRSKGKRSTSVGRPPVRPASIREEAPIASAKELLASQAAADAPANGSKQGSKSGKTFFACGAELDTISTFSKSTYHDQTDDLPVVYREDEIEPPEDKAKVSSLLSAYLSLGSKEDLAKVVEKSNAAAEAAPMATISVAAEGKSHKSRKSAKSKGSHRSNMPSQTSHRSRSRSATRSSHRNMPSQKSHRSRSTQRTRKQSIATRGTMLSQMGEEMGLEDVLAVSEEEESVKSSDSGARSRMSVQKGLRRQGSSTSIKRQGSSVRHGSTRTDKYGSTRTDTTEKIDNTSLTKLQNAEDAAKVIMAGAAEDCDNTIDDLNHIPSKESRRHRKLTQEDATYDGTVAGETVSTYASNFTGRNTRGTYETLSTAGRKSQKQDIAEALRDQFAPVLDDRSTFSKSTIPMPSSVAASKSRVRTNSTYGTRSTRRLQNDDLSFVSGDDTFSRVSAGSESDIGSYEYRRGQTLGNMLR